MIDLGGIAARAYTPGVKSANTGAAVSQTVENKNPARIPVTDRRLAPAFSIELSLAAQKILDNVNQAAPAEAEKVAASKIESSYNSFNEGVGRREAPLGNEQRDVALGSQLNIQI